MIILTTIPLEIGIKLTNRPTRRNHYLPQVYLKSFLTNDVFWVYYKGRNKPVAQTPVNTGVKKNIYNLRGPDGSVDDSLEKVLSMTENDLRTIMEKAVEPKYRLHEDDIEKLAIFFSFLATRVPKNIEEARELFKEFVIHKLKKDSANTNELENAIDYLKQTEKDAILTLEQLQEYYKDIEKYFNLSVNEKFAMIMSIDQSKNIYYELREMNWCLCKAPSGNLFITSDAPLVPFASRPDGSALIGAGYGLDNVEITIPISPFLCIYMTRKPIQKYRPANKNFVIEINRRTAWNAEKMIISSIKTNYLRELTNWATKSLHTPRIDKDRLRYLLEISEDE
ncbi:MAG TPA: DUF4238 domain-containing protein [Thermodesulfobacteriota bacterium]|nr:DUF4238 domain-containing protein [Thermodesulfobacteriota bacterium]